MWRNRQLYDFSNIEKGNGLYTVAEKYCKENGLDLKKELNKGKAIPGLMKDEVNDSEITEVVSVKAK